LSVRFLLCLLSFSFGHCVVCSSSIYGFWLLLWYLPTKGGRHALVVFMTLIINHQTQMSFLTTYRDQSKY
jgi:hypothetical protein